MREALLRTVIAKGRVAVQNPKDYDSMSELMWAGSLSHNGLTGLGGMKDFAVHQLGHELSLPCLTPPTVLPLVTSLGFLGEGCLPDKTVPLRAFRKKCMGYRGNR